MNGPHYTLGRWKLDDLIAAETGPAMEQALAELDEAAAALESHRDALPAGTAVDGDRLGLLLEQRERLERAKRRINGYAQLRFAADTEDERAASLRGRAERLLAEANNRTLFFELWWKGLDDAASAALLTGTGDTRYYLESLRRAKPYTLSEPEERLINLKDVTGVQALHALYEMYTFGFTYTLSVDGETHEVDRGRLMAHAADPSPEVRKAAYDELLRVFGASRGVLGQVYRSVAMDWCTEAITLRGHTSPIAARNLKNDLDDGVVDTVLETCRANAALFQRYFRLKAKAIGMERLRRVDLYAPLAPATKEYPFDDAVRLILDALRGFSDEVAEMAARVLDERHLDAEPRAGKTAGAFCYGVLPGVTPWVLTNYAGRASDVATLAHELGHAVHAIMASDRPALTFDASLPLAETASVFSEMLLLDRMLEVESAPAARREILGRFLDGAYATILRQAYFVQFERTAHDLLAHGEVTTDELADRYAAQLAEQFGDSVSVGESFRWEWLAIPHIYTVPFYCYAYSFGQLLVLSLYRAYRRDAAAFVPRFTRILAYGGAASPAAILEEAGIDIADPTFWQGGFDVLREMVDQLEGM